MAAGRPVGNLLDERLEGVRLKVHAVLPERLQDLVSEQPIPIEEPLDQDTGLAQRAGASGGTPLSPPLRPEVHKQALDHHVQVRLEPALPAELPNPPVVVLDKLERHVGPEVLSIRRIEAMARRDEVDDFLNPAELSLEDFFPHVASCLSRFRLSWSPTSGRAKPNKGDCLSQLRTRKKCGWRRSHSSYRSR